MLIAFGLISPLAFHVKVDKFVSLSLTRPSSVRDLRNRILSTAIEVRVGVSDKIALKKLTGSDLTFFEWQFRNRKNGGNQKSINLNADIFIKEFYPSVPQNNPASDRKIPVEVNLFGPGIKGVYSLARKIVKKGSYKNWRLNGEFVYNPENDPDRFNKLMPGDLALIIFKGDQAPTGVDIIFLSAYEPADTALYGQLSPLVPDGKKSMIRLSRAALESAAAAVDVPPGHPIKPFLSDSGFSAALEDAAYGEASANSKIRHQYARRVSATDLAKARWNADRIGHDGEGLVYSSLEIWRREGRFSSVEWTSDENTVSPYDFRVSISTGNDIKIDAKSTEGDFDRTIHISAAELREAATGPEQYDLYRVYKIDDNGASLRIAEDIGEFACKIIDGLNSLPEGVRPDSFSVNPRALKWGPEIRIVRPEDSEDDGD